MNVSTYIFGWILATLLGAVFHLWKDGGFWKLVLLLLSDPRRCLASYAYYAYYDRYKRLRRHGGGTGGSCCRAAHGRSWAFGWFRSADYGRNIALGASLLRLSGCRNNTKAESHEQS